MRVPSGDQAGARSAAGRSGEVTCDRPVPSAFITQSRVVPERLEEKAMRVPSGDQEGSRS